MFFAFMRLKENHRSVNTRRDKCVSRNLDIYSRAHHCPVNLPSGHMRSRSSKANEPSLFIQVTSKNSKRVLVFPSFLSPESRNVDDAL